MLTPELPTVVRAVANAIDDIIAPALTGLRERSAIATIRNMLSYIELNAEKQAETLFDEARHLRDVLGRVAEKLQSDSATAATGVALRDALKKQRDPALYPSAARLAEELRELRAHADTALKAVLAIPERDRSQAALAARQEIRDYLLWQLKQEARLVEPSFVGQGARR